MSGMRLGVVAPIGLPASGLRDWAQEAEELNLDHLVVTDHVLGVSGEHQQKGWDRHFPHAVHEDSYSDRTPFNEPMVTLGYLAGVSSLELVTGVLVLPQRNTAVVAKEAAQIDLLTGGKLRLGVSIGWNRVEFSALGADFASRGELFTEQVTLLRKYWTEELVFFDGRYHQVSGVALAPLPVQRPIPLWFGGASPEHAAPRRHLLDRIARLADGWYFDAGVAPNARTADALYDLRQMLKEHGRDQDDFGVDARINLARASRDDVAFVARQWRELGVTHLTVDLRNAHHAGWSESPTTDGTLTTVVELVRQGLSR